MKKQENFQLYVAIIQVGLRCQVFAAVNAAGQVKNGKHNKK